MTVALPETLYHYTTQRGLLGICEKRKFWATKAYYLNDGREISYGFNLARKYLEGTSKFAVQDADGILLRKMHEYIERVSFMNVCVGSFTENGDLLSQWRGYGRPGDAYSIGFPTTYLQEAFRSRMWQLSPCLYDEEAQTEAIAGVVARTQERFRVRTQELEPEKPVSESAEVEGFTYLFDLLRVAAAIKHPSFKEECEWRLISGRLDAKDMSLRQGRHTLIPYHELALHHFEDVPLTVTVGATQHPDLAVEAVVSLMQKEGLAWKAVNKAKSTYRDW